MSQINDKTNNKKDSGVCHHTKEQFADYLTNELEQAELEQVRHHVSECSDCQGELEELTSLWTRMGVLPEVEPGPNLRKNFYAMLESYQEGMNRKNVFQRSMDNLFGWLGSLRRPVVQLAFTIVFLVVGFTAGFYFSSSSTGREGGAATDEEVVQLRGQVQQMRQDLVLAMLDQPSPSQRLKAISWSSMVENPGNDTLAALLNTLNNDPNDNVRVSAAEALYLFIRTPMVKQGIIDSLPRQSSPMVQVALMDLIAAMREDKAVNALKLLLKKNKLNPAVEKRAKTLMNLL